MPPWRRPSQQRRRRRHTSLARLALHTCLRSATAFIFNRAKEELAAAAAAAAAALAVAVAAAAATAAAVVE